jgi:hypothetical protein
MIGKAYKLGTSFKELAAYLKRGHLNQTDMGGDAWTESRNLPTRDPEVAACLMAATAAYSTRCRKPVYHLSINFDPSDPLDRETMRRVADHTLGELGLEDHQTLIVAHCGREHPHMHIVVNRVHPERGTAWSNSWDYRRIERSLRALEAELGLRAVPGRHAPVPERARHLIRPAHACLPGDAIFAERVRVQAGPHLSGARSWAELEHELSEHGLWLRMKGGGLIVTDGRQAVSASAIASDASRSRLERRLGLYGGHRSRGAVAAVGAGAILPG